MRFIAVGEDLEGRRIGVLDGKKTTELKDLSAGKRSTGYAVQAASVELIALDRERPGGEASGVELTIPEGMESPLVLVFPDGDDAAGFRAVVVDDSAKGFPWGSLRFVNTTERALELRYDMESEEVAASSAVVDISPGGEARNLGVQLTAEEDSEEVLYSAVWEHDPNLRKLIFILGGGGDGMAELSVAIIPQDKRSED